MDKKAPINTVKEAREGLSLGVFLATNNAIEIQEIQGQYSFISSDTLPTNMGFEPEVAKQLLEVAGVKFLGPVEDDEIFQYVELPAGWTKIPTSHPSWSKLLDEKGRERANIFYKATFYDRGAHLSIRCRFRAEFDYELFQKEQVAVAHVMDGEQIMYTTDPAAANGHPFYMLDRLLKPIAEQWLDKHYPDWRDPGAYWD